ncbi:DUF1254 domain-containing protein [Streptomyces sp. NPDC096152]|uniref:DUF1254 domain-containing protein n=1 Tax=Streptomyces sp. NPDC096152 TaxID=3366078 RepID=UPI0037FC8984
MTTATATRSPAQRVRDQLTEMTSAIGHAATATGRATADAVRHPGALVGHARRTTQALPLMWQSVKPVLTGRLSDWRREYAYTLGEQAFLYGFPYIYYAGIRHRWVTQEPESATTPYAAVNHFWHGRTLYDASNREGLTPNNDTLYSFAWVDLSAEPVVLSHPDMDDRYFTFELVGITSDNYDYVGQRATGSRSGHFALVGPDWTGDLTEVVRRTATAPTPWVLVIGRTLVAGEDDLTDVHALQDQYRLTPLSLYGTERAAPESRDVLEPVDEDEDPLGPWKTLNAMLAENPPPAHHEVLLKQFAEIGIGPGLDVEAQPEAVRQSLIRAAATGVDLLEQELLGGEWAPVVNGWRYPAPGLGRFGDQFLRRAAEQALIGVAANDPVESVYLFAVDDADGDELTTGHYELRFEPGDLPPVDAFWSLVVYGMDRNLVPNPIDRYSIGDRTPGLVTGPDGSLTIHLRPKSPGPDRVSNWLPTPERGNWYIGLRMYLPRPEVLDGRWECPPINRVT